MNQLPAREHVRAKNLIEFFEKSAGIGSLIANIGKGIAWEPVQSVGKLLPAQHRDKWTNFADLTFSRPAVVGAVGATTGAAIHNATSEARASNAVDTLIAKHPQVDPVASVDKYIQSKKDPKDTVTSPWATAAMIGIPTVGGILLLDQILRSNKEKEKQLKTGPGTSIEDDNEVL